MQQLSIKRGDTLYAECQLVDEFGTGKPITGMVVSARLLDRGGNVAHTFNVVVANDNNGQFALAQFDTSNLAAGLYVLEISYSRDGVKTGTNAFELVVMKNVDRDPQKFAYVSSTVGNTKVLITVPATEIQINIWSSSWDVQWVND